MTDCPGLAAPQGHYAHAARAGQFLCISGQLPETGEGLSPADFEAQTRSAVGRLLTILREAGGTPADLLKVTAYIVGIENWPLFNRVYAEIMGEARPARAVVPVPELHHGWRVEIEAIACFADANRPGVA